MTESPAPGGPTAAVAAPPPVVTPVAAAPAPAPVAAPSLFAEFSQPQQDTRQRTATDAVAVDVLASISLGLPVVRSAADASVAATTPAAQRTRADTEVPLSPAADSSAPSSPSTARPGSAAATRLQEMMDRMKMRTEQLRVKRPGSTADTPQTTEPAVVADAAVASPTVADSAEAKAAPASLLSLRAAFAGTTRTSRCGH